MGCPFKENEECSKKFGKCALFAFLTILGVAVGLKIITLILCILPGSSHGNTWLVVVATVMVLFAAKYHNKKACCGDSCDCPCHNEKADKNCCNKKDLKKESSVTDKEA
ncbi:hypothetical protein LO80_05960 [Candidatus Francisella endociliophora]|uniref:Uncharacterized protein n=1 Tax=Candidatus Francisella endociliophora TaxID=653937 RepID=A0A097EPQ8_9GAMM|nr:hypothetical protein [Francisella sp. FSC1006]AIT09553.1 hypothetical protein LO80_05960 [Francisella sp. FSC1006]